MLRRAVLVAAVVAVSACGSSPSVLAPQSTASLVSSSAVPSTSPATPAVTPSTTALPIQQGLTVTASPRTGLVEGRAVTAHGEGWPPGMEVGVEQCAANRFPADRNECEINRSVVVTSDATGKWDVRIYVVRTLVVSGRSIDCATNSCTLTASVIVDGVPATRAPGAGASNYVAVGEVGAGALSHACARSSTRHTFAC